MMKGVAIIFMLTLHLFNQPAAMSICKPLIYIDLSFIGGGKGPLAHLVTAACNPVGFFLLLGGYGCYVVNRKGDRRRWSRLLRIYVHYWIVMIAFLFVGWLVNPRLYPGNAVTLLSNLTGFHTTYNGEMWFLLPYVILSASSPWLFTVMNRFRSWQTVGFTFLLHLGTSYCISRYGETFLFHNYWIYTPLLVVHLLFNFSVGAMAARTDFFGSCRRWAAGFRQGRLLMYATAVVLFMVAVVFKYNFFYPLLFTAAIVSARLPRWLMEMLETFGRQSMNMWMIHTWLCYYLFREIFYAPRIPVLILLLLLTTSYLLGLAVDRLAAPVWQFLSMRCSRQE